VSAINLQLKMLEAVADALGEELINDVVFVGGCTTGLLVTDDFIKEQIRYTDDVDLIVDVMGYAGWSELQDKLKSKGFSIEMGEEVICRMSLNGLKVDFMPTDSAALGFTNRWYKDAIETALDYQLNNRMTIKLIKPEYFVATKLEAYCGRGRGDALTSHDIEDIINVFDGRDSIVAEIQDSPTGLRDYISEQIQSLLDDMNFEYAVQDASRNDSKREALIFERLMGCLIND